MSKEEIVKNFSKTMFQFFEALSDCFDKCDDCKNLVELFKMYKEQDPNFDENIVRRYHMTMSAYYNKEFKDYVCELDKMPMMSKIDIGNKWKSADDDTKTAIVEYVSDLNQKAKAYNIISSVPDSLITKVESISNKITGDIKKKQNGDLDLDSISLGDIIRTVQTEIGDPSKLNINQADLMSMAGSLMSGMGGGASGGGLDLSALMSMMAQNQNK